MIPGVIQNGRFFGKKGGERELTAKGKDCFRSLTSSFGGKGTERVFIGQIASLLYEGWRGPM